ncbi:tetratricopeptide repeat protein [Pusillimonas noertemannii]|uniref:tetratricopeptide repeat protein n=1 Tax=Pusillimonas noertemannii TaxID=305977 RepID=UPI0002E49D25|nr:hypothetical protein [Pusillimonas noertemannii]
MELPDHIYAQVEILAEQGNEMLDDEDYEGALASWSEALELLPEPRNDWDAAMWLHASMAEAHYQLRDFESARDAMYDALNAPGGNENPYVHYMLGKALLRLDDEKAVDALLRAYMLDGEDIFDSDEEEGPDALRLLQERGLADE